MIIIPIRYRCYRRKITNNQFLDRPIYAWIATDMFLASVYS